MMTNREYLAHLLNDPDWIDDGGAAYGSMVLYNIRCPYQDGDKRCHCNGKENNYEKYCEWCKLEWLEADVDE